ncbi:hypothetical protein FXW78_43070 [Rhodococcus opacus]|nr:hypothetical protein [Rhodococcus opacus]
MATDFAVFLRRFLTAHLAGLRGCSPHTIASYRDAFKLLICYFRDERSIPPDKLTLELIDAAAIAGFLTWLRTSRHNTASTSNQRLAAIDSFFTWMQSEDPARMACSQDILAIPAMKHDRPALAHLSSNRPASCSPSPTGPPAPADETRPCWPPCMTPPPGSKNSPTSPCATSVSITPPWPP